MKKLSSKAIVFTIITSIISIIINTTPLFARSKKKDNKKVEVYIKWEKYKNAVKYKIKIMNYDGEVLVNKITSKTEINGRLSSGTYKAKIGYIKDAKNERVYRESKWLTFPIKVNKEIKPPTNAVYTIIKEKDGKSLNANFQWQAVGAIKEKTIFYEVYRRAGDKYVSVGKTGFLRIGEIPNKRNSVEKYLIYKWRGKNFRLIGETSGTTFSLNGLLPGEKHFFSVRSMNRQGIKSLKNDFNCVENTFETSHQLGLNISTAPSFIVPFGKFSSYLSTGWGATISASMNNVLFKNFELGIESGYWLFSGKGDYDRSMIIPVFITANYNFKITRSLKWAPIISSGISIAGNDIDNGEPTSVIMPSFMGGLTIEKTFANSFFIKGESQCGVLFDTDSPRGVLLFSVRLGVLY
ncbi:MAG: hypothetical protein GY754_12600 [bacterium]|nr:hypothetical protein [bacterium]